MITCILQIFDDVRPSDTYRTFIGMTDGSFDLSVLDRNGFKCVIQNDFHHIMTVLERYRSLED